MPMPFDGSIRAIKAGVVPVLVQCTLPVNDSIVEFLLHKKGEQKGSFANDTNNFTVCPSMSMYDLKKGSNSNRPRKQWLV